MILWWPVIMLGKLVSLLWWHICTGGEALHEFLALLSIFSTPFVCHAAQQVWKWSHVISSEVPVHLSCDCVCVCACVRVCAYTCMHVCEWVHVRVFVCMCAYTRYFFCVLIPICDLNLDRRTFTISKPYFLSMYTTPTHLVSFVTPSSLIIYDFWGATYREHADTMTLMWFIVLQRVVV